MKKKCSFLFPIHFIDGKKGLRALGMVAMLLLICSVQLSKAQHPGKTVTGIITDTKGGTLPGVSIVIQGTSSGTVTDPSGKYSLPGVKDNDTLVITYVGMVPQKIAVGGRAIIDVVMAEALVDLDEVVVVGYGVQKKSDLTGAIVSVKEEDLKNRSTTTVVSALVGKTAGLTFVNTAGSAPGATATIHIRGYSSNTSSNPLYVVDGLRQSSITYLDPNDVESIEILKDAASAAIYGQEAGNGVILVTTRKGKMGEGKISYDFQLTLDNIARVPKVMNSQQYCTWLKEAGVYTDATYNNLITSRAWDGVSTTDWADVAFETGVTRRHNLSFTGGNTEGSIYFSGSYLESDGMVVNSNDFYRRITATLNIDRKVRSWLKVATNNNVENYSYRNILNTGTSPSYSLFAGIINLDPTFSPIYAKDALPTHMQTILNTGNYTLMGNDKGYYGWSALQTIEQFNPLISTNTSHADNVGFNVRGATYLDLTPDFIKGLVFTSRLSYSLGSSDSYSYGYKYYANTNAYVNQHEVSRSESNSIFTNWENFANYTRALGSHFINITAGTSYQASRAKYIKGTVTDVVNDDWYLWGALSNKTTAATTTASDSDTQVRKISYFGQFNYNYGDRYLLKGILRADAADLAYLPKANRWGYFPSLSAGWTISNENFFPKTDLVSFLKLRFSWGENGSLGPLGGYRYASSMIYSTYGYTFDIAGVGDSPIYQRLAYPSNIVNNELSWEKSVQTDLALDARFLKNRLTLTLDYYVKKTKDLIVTGVTLPLASGNSAPPINAGNVENKGLEVELGWQNKIGDFSYSVKGNLATLRNKVTYIDPSLTRLPGTSDFTFGYISAFEVGHPVWYFWGYKYAGVDQATGDPLFYNKNGDIVTGNNVDENSGKFEIGKGLPDFSYGITVNASWKGVDLVIFGSGAGGNEIFSCLGYSVYHNMLDDYYNERWVAGADNANAKRPRAACNYLDKYMTSDAFVYNGSYFKIKQIQLGYTLPQKFTKKLGISNLRITASLDDWFTFTSYPGLDPEASSNSYSGMGIDFGSYPNARKTMMGVSLTF